MEVKTSTDFLKEAKANPCGAFLFFGDEDYLKSHAIRVLKDAMEIDPALEIFNFVQIDVLDYTPDKLIDALTPPPMMAEQKLVVVSGLDMTKMRQGEIADLLNAIAHLEEYDYNTFVLSLPSGCIDEGTAKKPSATFSALCERLTPVKFERSTPQKLASWAMRHFEHHGIKANLQDCTYLVQYCGTSMFTLANEIEKLSLYAKNHNRNALLREDIPLVCAYEIEYDTFAFSNAVLANKRAEALSILSTMKFKQIDPLAIMGELAAIWCDLTTIKIMLISGKNLDAIIKEMKKKNFHEYKTKLYVRAAQGMELSRLQHLVEMAHHANLAMKLSDSSYLQLEKLICSI